MGIAISKRLDEYLFAKDISLYRLAKEACIPLSTLQNLYRGHTKSPSLSLLFKIAETLDVSISEFLASPLFAPDNLELD